MKWNEYEICTQPLLTNHESPGVFEDWHNGTSSYVIPLHMMHRIECPVAVVY